MVVPKWAYLLVSTFCVGRQFYEQIHTLAVKIVMYPDG
jgi:hypothetical protein